MIRTLWAGWCVLWGCLGALLLLLHAVDGLLEAWDRGHPREEEYG